MHHSIAPQSSRPSPIRFTPVLHLTSGAPFTLLAEAQRSFEERVAFGPAAASRPAPTTPAAHTAEELLRIARLAHEQSDIRPIIVPLTLAALIHADTPEACDAAIRRTVLCPQEICFEVTDAALSVPSAQARKGLARLRTLGFRLSLDVTRSWQTPLATDLRLLLETLRIDARHLDTGKGLEDRIEAATACGMQVIAERAHWRDGDWLASMGIDYAVRPKADG